MAGTNRAAEFAGNFKAQRKCREHVGAGRAGGFAHGERGGSHGRAGMAAQARQAVVEVERVSGDAVGERGFGG